MAFFISKITHGGGRHGYRPELQIEVGVHFMLTGEGECVCICVCERGPFEVEMAPGWQ